MPKKRAIASSLAIVFMALLFVGQAAGQMTVTYPQFQDPVVGSFSSPRVVNVSKSPCRPRVQRARPATAGDETHRRAARWLGPPLLRSSKREGMRDVSW